MPPKQVCGFCTISPRRLSPAVERDAFFADETEGLQRRLPGILAAWAALWAGTRGHSRVSDFDRSTVRGGGGFPEAEGLRRPCRGCSDNCGKIPQTRRSLILRVHVPG